MEMYIIQISELVASIIVPYCETIMFRFQSFYSFFFTATFFNENLFYPPTEMFGGSCLKFFEESKEMDCTLYRFFQLRLWHPHVKGLPSDTAAVGTLLVGTEFE